MEQPASPGYNEGLTASGPWSIDPTRGMPMLTAIHAYFSLQDGAYLLLAAGYLLELIHHAESDFWRWRKEKKSGCLMLRQMLADLVLLSGLALVLVGYISAYAAGH